MLVVVYVLVRLCILSNVFRFELAFGVISFLSSPVNETATKLLTLAKERG